MSDTWWKEAVVYQIYPRSFQDSNNDGIGDLNGVRQRLDYLQTLGVDVLWLCPFYPSPNDDNGYDISDYRNIMPEFGTLQDFDALLDDVHGRGMRLVIDLVLNHTSDEHPWFIESRSSLDNPKRDWYIWRDGSNGRPPNNWESLFSGSAWRYDQATDQYYLHLFTAKQPDLNWENPDVRQALYEMVRWWADRGVDGFRLDAINHLCKAPGLPDAPNPANQQYADATSLHRNVPGIENYIAELSAETFSRYDVMTVGEASDVTAEGARDWVDPSKNRLNMLFQFEQLKLWGSDVEPELNLPALKDTLTRWQKTLNGHGWNALFLENHDIARIVSVWGDPEQYWYESATAIAAMYFLMQGTPYIYQGQELGMTNFPFTRLSEFRDVAVHNLAHEKLKKEGWTEQDVVESIALTARDNARTPMQWTSEPNGGFTDATPWLPPNPNCQWLNAESQLRDPNSVFTFYQRLIQLRRASRLWIYGEYRLLLPDHNQVFAYERQHEQSTGRVIVNLSGEPADIRQLEMSAGSPALMVHNYQSTTDLQTLRPWEAVVVEC